MDGPLTEARGASLGPLWRGHARRLGAGLACLLGLALTTSAYAYLAGPVVELLLTGAVRGPGSMLQQLPWLQRVALEGRSSLLWVVAGLLVGLAVLKGLCQLGASLWLEGTSERVGSELRQRLYGHLLALPLRSHRQQAIGDLLARLLDDVRRVQEALLAAPLALLREGLAAAGLCAVALITAPWLALLGLIALPLTGLLIGALGRAVKAAAAGAQAQLGELTARAVQGLGAVREVKSCCAEERELERVGRHAKEALRFALRHLRARALSPLANEVIAAVGLGAVLVYAGDRVARGQLAPERFLSFFTAVLLLYRPLKEIGRAIHQRAAGRASLERIEALLALSPEPSPASGRELLPLRRALVLEGIGFRYPGGAAPVLRGITLELPVGQVVAVTGPSGAGKSTLADVACGLEPPDQGRLRWDGEDVGPAPQRLRAAVALVPQQPLMFDGTLEENLRYGAPRASQAELQRALEEADLGARVERLPGGLATRLGAGGIQLSVGEAQRLALARALLRAASVIILDEPTSALDADSRDRLLGAVRRAAAGGKAVLLLAHGAPALAAADKVWELREGELVAAPELSPREAGR